MTFSRTAIAAAVVTLLLATTGAIASVCNPANVVRLSLDTPQTEFVRATTIALQPVVVRTLDIMGAYINTGIVDVTIRAPTGVTMSVSSATTQTTAAGTVTFSGITLTSPPKGSNFIEFDLICSSTVVRTERLEVYITSGDATQIKWYQPPESSITNYGTFPIAPQLALYDVSNNVVDMPDTSTPWTLTTNDATLNARMTGNSVTPSLISGPIVTFDSLRFNIQPGEFDGRTFELSLNSVGGNVGTPSDITYPGAISMTIAFCKNNYAISVANAGASEDNPIVEAITDSLTTWAVIRGWGTFLSTASGACRFAGGSRAYQYQDVCNVKCQVPGTSGSQGILELSLDGVAFMSLGNVRIAGPIHELRPHESTIVLYRQQLTYTTVHFAAVDENGFWLGDRVAAGHTMNCHARHPYSAQKRVTTSFFDTYINAQRTPVVTPTVVRGNASVDFVFDNYLEPDRHIFCCNASGVVSRAACVTIEIQEDCTSPPTLDSVSSVGCDTDSATGDLTDCLTDGSRELVIRGLNFGYSGARVRVGPRYCDSVEHHPHEPGRVLLARGCKGTGVNHTVLILRPDAKVYVLWPNKLHFTRTPVITSIKGCLDFFPSTANCLTGGNNMVQITGMNFGMSGATVHFYYFDAPGSVIRITAATTVHIAGSEATIVNASGFPGQGSRFAVAVETNRGELGKNTEVTMSYEASLIVPCPKGSNNVQCNGKGTCNTAVGTCTCLAESGAGYWAGSACDNCKAGYYGSNCNDECPGGAASPCSGVSQGTCADGLTGAGTCTCANGYGGTACQTVCPGGIASPCNNHGTCLQGQNPPLCDCAQTTAAGFWTGSTCNTCDSLYVGAGCQERCPTTSSLPCSGHGNCSTATVGGVATAACTCETAYCSSDCSKTGADCGTCPTGKYGTGCVNSCPGFDGSDAGTICNGHGNCGVGTLGSGLCICTAGFAGAACEKRCETNQTSLVCSGAGTCDSVIGECNCNFGYGGLDCATQCPGFGSLAGVCSGKGTCQSRTAQCQCIRGYTDADCSGICPGGLSSPCSNHGTCNNNNTCTCHRSDALGFWAGAECSTCAEGKYGPFCNETCIDGPNGQMCSGHGSCTQTVTCSCIDNSVQGYWFGEACERCQPNYYGPNCTKQCPGGACNACSGNGVCSDGLTGLGQCTCFTNATNGFWQGAKCDTCQQNYFGLTCATECPRGGPFNQICGGHGVCSDGIRGTGVCSCIAGTASGFWGGSSCAECLNGYYGSNCTERCPGSDGLGTTCSGRGTCDDGFSGTGVCTCQTGYGLQDCSSGCPLTSPSVYCNGNGVCLDGADRNGTCQCYRSDGYGYWSDSSCSSCQYGFYGASCIQACPSAGGSVCAGHGTCDSGTNNTGTCTCDSGYAESDCARECDGGASNPCSGNGMCDQTTGTCTCYSSSSLGFWDGSNCSSCSALYNSTDCTTRCPTTAANADIPCDGHGSCYEGICECEVGFCGDKCELSGNDCLSECPEGYYSSDCSGICPGEDNNWCFGHGACSQGLKGDGRCSCYAGYWGTDCAGECPGGAASPCAGHGNCLQDQGTCSCSSGWATDDCSTECPGGFRNPCTGQGTCLPKTGDCDCTFGFAGMACELECPGGHLNPCSGNGQCNSIAGNCTCWNGEDGNGYWNGTMCDVCLSGWYGNGTCDKQCINGYTNGTTCMCNEGWSGEDCSVPCPGIGSALGVCSGHGTCLWGHTYTAGECVCDTDYFTSDCSKYCSPTKCSQQPYYLVNGQCDTTTGECACVQNSTHGYWTDPATRCTTCKLFWWGTSCTERCPCLERGGCDKTSGACQCFDSDSDGHFDGVACERCKTGFLGAECKGKDIVITRQKPCSSIAVVKSTSQFMMLDRTMDVVITGSRPVVVCNLTTRTLLGRFEFDGSVIDGSIHDGNNYILTLGSLDNITDTYAQKRIRIRRERRPTFAIQAEGATYSNNASNIANTGVSLRARRADGRDFVAENVDVSAGHQLSTGRRLQTVGLYNEPILVKTIALSETEFLTVMSNGVVTRTVGLDVVGQYNFGAFFAQVMAADVTSTLLISPSLLFLGGVANGTTGSFQLISVALPLSASNTIQILTSELDAKSTYCASSTCRAIAGLVSDGTYVVMAVLTGDGAGIMRFRYTQLFDANYAVESNAILSRYDSSTVVNVTAMLLDPLSSAGFVAMNLQSPDSTEPSTIYKFDLLDLQVYGSVRFQKVVTNYEIVTALSKDDVSRILFATVPLELQINVVPLNLYAVTKVYPHIADTSGGTVVTVEGEGFINDDFLRCDFNGTIVQATYVSSREALCVAPIGGDERCEGVPLEITVQPGQYTKNNVLLRRVSSPRINKVYALRRRTDDVDNAYGNTTGGEVVMLEGFGFQDSPFLACRFSSESETHYARYADRDYAYSNGAQGVLFRNARFINATHMECDQPAFVTPTSGTSTVEVTLDGTVYSDSRQTYQAVGPAIGLSSFRSASAGQWAADSAMTFTSQDRVELPEITVFIVDSTLQRLRSLDAVTRRLSVRMSNFTKLSMTTSNFSNCDHPPTEQGYPVFHTTGVTSTITVDGRAVFSGMYFLRPPAGVYGLTFTDETTGWTFEHSFRVTVGEAYRLRICTEPPATLNNNLRQLTGSTKLYVEDISSNQLPAANLAGIRVEASYQRERTETTPQDPGDAAAGRKVGVRVTVNRISAIERRVAELQDDFLKFDGLEMTGLYGKTYHINFTAPGLVNTTSRGIVVEWCPDRFDQFRENPNTVMYFAKLNTSECFKCPTAAACRGTDEVTVYQDNFWRPSPQSFLFYSCSTEEKASESCLRPNGTCMYGYQGPRCSVCIDGWGKTGGQCLECASEGAVVGYMLAIVGITLLFVGILVYTTLSASLSETLPVVIKIAINHFQVSSRVNEIILGLPPVLKDLFNFQLQISELIRFDIVSTECAPLKLDIYGKFYLIMAIPFCIMLVFAIGLLVLSLWRSLTGSYIRYEKVEIDSGKGTQHRRDRVMLAIARFISNIRAAAVRHHGDLARDDLRKQFYTCPQYFAATAIIVLCLVYPSMLQWCVTMWDCDTVVFGDAETFREVEYLRVDRRVICTDSRHKVIQLVSIICALVYGIVVPFLAIGLVYAHWTEYGRVHARHLYKFVTAGYDITTWFWEAVVMARKAAIVFIIIFVKDPTLRTYLAMWTMTLALGAHGWFQPYDPRRPSLYYLEGLGITTIVVTLNLALLFQFDTFTEGRTEYTVLVIGLFVLNAITLVVFGFTIIYNIGVRIRNYFRQRKEEKEREAKAGEYEDNSIDTDSVDGDGFKDVDRRQVQREGILGAIRRASRAHLGMKDEAPKTVEKIDVRKVPKNDNETPFERLQRLEEERKRKEARASHVSNQAELERDLEELRDHMLRAQALAAAEDTVIERFPEVADMRAKHEEELYRLMDEIRRERGDFATGPAAASRAAPAAAPAGTTTDGDGAANSGDTGSHTAKDGSEDIDLDFEDEA